MLPAAVALLALAVRLVYLLRAAHLPTFLSPGMDAEVYRSWADAILQGSSPAGAYYRAPFYPMLIALLAKATGGGTFWPIRLFQVLLSAASTGVLALLARRWFGPKAGWITGIAWALYGMSIYFDGEGLIASSYTSLFIFLLLLLDHHRHRGSWTLAVAAGLLLGIMAGLRANALAWVPVLLWALWARPGATTSSDRRTRLLQPLLALFALLAILSPVLLHNMRTGGGFSISTQGGINLFLGNRHEASGAFAVDPDFGADWTEAETRLRAERIAGRPLSAGETSSHYAKQALRFWGEHPGEGLRLVGRKLLLSINASEIANNRVLKPFLWTVWPPFAWLALLGFPLLAVIGLPAIPFAWKRQPGLHPALVFAAVHAVTMLAFFITARYRFPIMPVLAVLFGAGSLRVIALVREPALPLRHRLMPGAFFVAVALLVLLPRPVGRIDEGPTWEVHRGNALLRLGHYQEAARIYESALAAGNHRENLHLNLGVALLNLGRRIDAREAFLDELRDHPQNGQAWNNLATLDEQEGDTLSARKGYRRALELNPTLDDARLNLSRVLAELSVHDAAAGRLDSALVHARDASELRPEAPVLRYNYALLLARTGQVDDAILELRATLAEHPDFSPARDALKRALQTP